MKSNQIREISFSYVDPMYISTKTYGTVSVVSPGNGHRQLIRYNIVQIADTKNIHIGYIICS